MDQLKKINARVRIKQNLELGGGLVLFFAAALCLENYAYSRGITDTQKYLAKNFREEYDSITKKVIELLENE